MLDTDSPGVSFKLHADQCDGLALCIADCVTSYVPRIYSSSVLFHMLTHIFPHAGKHICTFCH